MNKMFLKFGKKVRECDYGRMPTSKPKDSDRINKKSQKR